jgi:hypothetical protein
VLNREIVAAAAWLHGEVCRMAAYDPRWSREDLFRQAIHRGGHATQATDAALDELIVAKVLVADPHHDGWWMPGPTLDNWRPAVWALDRKMSQSG